MTITRIGNETRDRWSRVSSYNQCDNGRVRETRAELDVPNTFGI
jgi:hypothetical protein